MRDIRLPRWTAALLAALVAGACGDDEILVPELPGDVGFAPALGIDVGALVQVEDGIWYQVEEEGPVEGVQAVVGDSLAVDFTLWTSNATLIQTTNGGVPFEFVLGDPAIIDGFNLGIVGMRAGDERLLVIHPDRAFGRFENGDIPPNSWVVFRVSVLTNYGPPEESTT